MSTPVDANRGRADEALALGVGLVADLAHHHRIGSSPSSAQRLAQVGKRVRVGRAALPEQQLDGRVGGCTVMCRVGCRCIGRSWGHIRVIPFRGHQTVMSQYRQTFASASVRLEGVIEDFELCYQAASSRDPRFDGWFYTAVTSTGIYCRPSCPAMTPKREHVRFYPSAAAAQQAGFRACKRCRPDAAPGSPEWDGRADVGGPGDAADRRRRRRPRGRARPGRASSATACASFSACCWPRWAPGRSRSRAPSVPRRRAS